LIKEVDNIPPPKGPTRRKRYLKRISESQKRRFENPNERKKITYKFSFS
jgi:hypothetical protein